MARNLSVVDPCGDQPTKSSNTAGLTPTLPRVTRSKRGVASVELVFSDDAAPNNDHPLVSLSSSDRQRLRLIKLAEILAQVAVRREKQLTTNGKEAV